MGLCTHGKAANWCRWRPARPVADEAAGRAGALASRQGGWRRR